MNGMTRRSTQGWTVALVAAALVAAATGGAQAADKSANGGKKVDFTVRAEPVAAAPGANKILKYDASKGRFGLTLELQQQDVREQTLGDVQAGAYYRITPSLRVGGSVALGEQPLVQGVEPPRAAEQPKVRLETKFKF
jgi:hypothetical protein